MSLRARLLAAAVLLVSCLALSGYLIIRTIENSELHQLDSQLTASVPIAIGVAHNQPPPAAGSPADPQQPTVSATPTWPSSPTGNAPPSPLPKPPTANSPKPRRPWPRRSPPPNRQPSRSLNGSGQLESHPPAELPDGHQLLVAVFMGAINATTTELRTAMFAAGAVTALILLAAGFWIEHLGLRPIARMKHTAEAILAGDRKQRVAIPSAGVETAALAGALNSMLDQQQAIEDRLRQFVADASHELRTPTSVISGLTQLWRQGDLRDGQALQDAMRRIGQESSRMKALVEELLLLARLDEGMPLHRQPVDLTALTQRRPPGRRTPATRPVISPPTSNPTSGLPETKPPFVESSAISLPTPSSTPRPSPRSPYDSPDDQPAASSRSEDTGPGHDRRRSGPRLRPVLASRNQPHPNRIRARTPHRPSHRQRPRRNHSACKPHPNKAPPCRSNCRWKQNTRLPEPTWRPSRTPGSRSAKSDLVTPSRARGGGLGAPLTR